MGGRKQWKTSLFLLSRGCLFCCHLVSFMVSFLLHILSCLQICHWFLLSWFGCYVLLLFSGSGFLFFQLCLQCVHYIFRSVVCLSCFQSLCDTRPDQITESPNMWDLGLMLCFNLWISMLIPHSNLVVPASWHFHLAQKWPLPWPQNKPLKMVFVCLSFALNNVLKYRCLQYFLNMNQWAPPKP